MNSQRTVGGIHHITAISSRPSENVAFYENVLGLRLVKQTVNFDDPYTYHLYYGDDAGNPGTILTFFPWDVPPGQNGTGMVISTAFAIPPDSVEYWSERLTQQNIPLKQEVRFGDEVIRFNDPHGLPLELIASGADGLDGEEYRISGFHSATTQLKDLERTQVLLTKTMGLKLHGREGNRYRFTMTNQQGIGCFYDVVVEPEGPIGRQGAGTVHHIAFRTSSGDEQARWQQVLREDGYQVTSVRDRKYFKSIYFHEPSGVLFEIATDPPGFEVDEPLEHLGGKLMLPDQYEPHRAEITKRLPTLRPADFIHTYVEPSEAGKDDLTVVALHGTGGSERDLLSLAQLVSGGAAVISPRGKVVEDGMNRFFERLQPNVFNEHDVTKRADDLAAFIASAANRYRRSVDGLVAFGYSNGANIAAAMLFLKPQLFSRAVLLRPMLVLPQISPEDLENKEILILRGLSDEVIPAHSTDQLIRVLQNAGARVEVVEIEAGHQLTDQDVETARTWFARTGR